MTRVAPRKIKYCRVSFDQSKALEIRQGESNRPSFISTTPRRGNEITSYIYKTDIDNLVPGDFVVVPTSYKDNNSVEFKVGVFVRYDPVIGDINREDVKEIIQEVNLYEYHRREEIKRERKLILAELEERKKTFEEENLYRLLAEKDPQMKILIDRLNSLA